MHVGLINVMLDFAEFTLLTAHVPDKSRMGPNRELACRLGYGQSGTTRWILTVCMKWGWVLPSPPLKSYRPQKHDTHFNLRFAVVVNEAQVAAVAEPVQGTHSHSFI